MSYLDITDHFKMEEKKKLEEKVKLELSVKDVVLLNSKLGLRKLFTQKKPNLTRALKFASYEYKLQELQKEMIILLNWVMKNNEKVVVLFEGRDSAGKGGAIRRTTQHLNPRNFRVVALPKPTSEERGQWYFQRYVNKLPVPGEMVFFDRSWYNRAVVEPVNGFCTLKEYEVFMDQVNQFESMLIQSGIRLIKIYFSIDKEEQAKRFKEIKNDPLKKWKMTKVDLAAQDLWDEYTRYKERMFNHTHTDLSPWKIIQANKKPLARISAIEHILSSIPYVKEELVEESS